MSTSWHFAPSLAVLRSEINTRWPNRDKRSDGTIGDAAHSARLSDHNPNDRRSVNAFDIDEDGPNMGVILQALIGDPRVNYVIYERTIYSRSRLWVPRPYYGANPHDKHMHVSILQTVKAEQDTRPWGIAKPGPPATGVDDSKPVPAPTPTPAPAPAPTPTPGGLTMSDSQFKILNDKLNQIAAGVNGDNGANAKLADVASKDHAQFVKLQAQITDLTLKLRGDISEVKSGVSDLSAKMVEAVQDAASRGDISTEVESELLEAFQKALEGISATVTLGGAK